ncbi:MAG TPA: flagellar basal body rod C-terminal domain-containing protein [Candidatus Baltobacteraceae bacterium]|nr:flagellar basal body rod C-terminal domain-containing protein [Candidatus Baltobacteraceae bacterium]
MSEFDILRAAAAGMDAQRAALDVAAQNVALAETVPDRSFARLVPRFQLNAVADGDPPVDFEPPEEPDGDEAEDATSPVSFLGAIPQRGSEVNAVTEMVAVLDAQRAYEANASVFDVGKRLAERTIDLGRL